MTINNTATSVTVYGNGAQTVFGYSFLINSQGDAQLLLVDTSTGNETVLDASTWTLNNPNTATGGTFIYPNEGDPIPAGSALVLSRVAPAVQNTRLGNMGPFFQQAVESALDYIVEVVQQQGNNSQRATRAPDGETYFDGTLPVWSQRANSVLGFDSEGAIVMVPTDTSPRVLPVATIDGGLLVGDAGSGAFNQMLLTPGPNVAISSGASGITIDTVGGVLPSGGALGQVLINNGTASAGSWFVIPAATTGPVSSGDAALTGFTLAPWVVGDTAHIDGSNGVLQITALDPTPGPGKGVYAFTQAAGTIQVAGDQTANFVDIAPPNGLFGRVTPLTPGQAGTLRMDVNSVTFDGTHTFIPFGIYPATGSTIDASGTLVLPQTPVTGVSIVDGGAGFAVTQVFNPSWVSPPYAGYGPYSLQFTVTAIEVYAPDVRMTSESVSGTNPYFNNLPFLGDIGDRQAPLAVPALVTTGFMSELPIYSGGSGADVLVDFSSPSGPFLYGTFIINPTGSGGALTVNLPPSSSLIDGHHLKLITWRQFDTVSIVVNDGQSIAADITSLYPGVVVDLVWNETGLRWAVDGTGEKPGVASHRTMSFTSPGKPAAGTVMKVGTAWPGVIKGSFSDATLTWDGGNPAAAWKWAFTITNAGGTAIASPGTVTIQTTGSVTLPTFSDVSVPANSVGRFSLVGAADATASDPCFIVPFTQKG